MTRKLHLGVTEIPYPKGGKTTHDVAEILEPKYKIFETFTKDNEVKIREMLREQTERDARNLVKGRKPNMQPVFDQIKRSFKTYILTKQLDGRIRGVPTLASLRGVNHRLKHPYRKGNPVRPSFFDTGLLVSSFKAWVEDTE